MNLEEFREYVTRQRRQANDQRNAPKDDERKCSDVAANKQDEPLYRDHKSRTCATL